MLLLLNQKLPSKLKYAFILFSVFIGLLVLNASPTLAQSPSHAYINQTRSSTATNYFVSIGAEGEFGELTSNAKVDQSNEGEKDEAASLKRKWQGYGIRNEIGLEFLKFLQFNLGHTSLNLRSKDDSSETLAGSRLHGGAALTFYAPLGNLKFGGGLLGSRLDYRRQDKSTDYYGSGYYYDIGYNYFVSYNVSFYVTGKQNTETLIRNSGKELPRTLKVKTTSAGLGFKIWL